MIRQILARVFGIDRIAAQQTEQRNIITYTVWLTLLQNHKYQDKWSLAPHGFKVYSQAEEDGYIHEIFRSIGTGHSSFSEIGISQGRERNTRFLVRFGEP